ncbi:phthalate transporter like protein [Zymoseptoria brevis]|uniref:Phthalate transporter like protein n=1 Tax=Zymoseptoria brevis TaxID=1047168 RepID=A0A0F4GWR6_9PEZI|nr:phthalate transporter like protein [Zymoseptoria brevis]
MSTADEKAIQAPSASILSTDAEGLQDRHLEKRILRKIDLRLLPILGALYTISLIDRNNISVARISGLDEDLGLDVGTRASLALQQIFFVGYVLLEVPSNALIRRVGPAKLLSAIVVAWGLVSLGIGFIQTWQTLVVLRALLGLLEAGFYPGCIYLISSWYKRYELQKRLSAFFVTATVLSGFANIFALGLVQLERVSSYRGWRWIYIIEGSITVLLGVLAYFIIVDFPSSPRNTFLSAEEKQFVEARLESDRGADDSHAKLTMKVVLSTCSDWKIYSFSMMYFAGASGIYAFALFLPIILRNSLGFSRPLSFVLSAFPPVFSILVVIPISILADRLHTRGIPNIVQGLLGILGLCMTGFLNNPWARYVGTFLGYAGATGLVVTSMAWMTNNLRGDGKRAVATAVMISVSGIGGVYSSVVFRQQDAPDYVPGLVAVMCANGLAVALSTITTVVLRRQNRRAEQGEVILAGLEGFRSTP